MQIMKRSNFRVPGRAFFLVAAVAIGLCLCLCLTLPAWAQLALPPVGVPQPPTKLPVPQLQPAPTVPALPSAQQTPPVVKVPALPTTPVVPGLSSVLPATAPGVLNGLPLPVSPAAAPIAVPEVPVRESGASPMAQTPAGLLPLNQLRVATVRELLVQLARAGSYQFHWAYTTQDVDGPAGDVFGVLVDGQRLTLSDPGGAVAQVRVDRQQALPPRGVQRLHNGVRRQALPHHSPHPCVTTRDTLPRISARSAQSLRA